MGVMVIVGYRPGPGQEAALLAEVRAHVPALRAEGLATDRPALAMRAADGTIVEVFEWVSQEAIDAAHGNPVVQKMWERFGACSEYVPVGDLDEARQLFSAFAPLDTRPDPESGHPDSMMTAHAASLLSHGSLGTNDIEAAAAFYDRVLATLGARRVMEHPGAVAYGRTFPEFWIQVPIDGEPAETANGSHVAFLAESRAQVAAFHAAALAAGGIDDGPPGARSDCGAAYFGCFIRDPDGHKIEAMFWDPGADSSA